MILGSYQSNIKSRKSQQIANYFENNIVYNLTLEICWVSGDQRKAV